MPQRRYTSMPVSSSDYTNQANNGYDYNPSQSGNRKHHTSSDTRMAGFEKFVRRYESCIIYTIQFGKNHLFLSFLLVNSTFASKLRGLDGYEIVFICDDSGSMNTELSELFFPSIYLTHQFLVSNSR